MMPGVTRYSDTVEDIEDRLLPRDTEEGDVRLPRRNDTQLTRQLMAALAAFLAAGDPTQRKQAHLYGRYVYETACKRRPDIAAELSKEMGHE